MNDLVEFLIGCITEEVSDARRTIEEMGRLGADVRVEVTPAAFEDHLIRWLPERVLAECEAKLRRIEVLTRMSGEPLAQLPAAEREIMTGVRATAEFLLRLEALLYVNQPGFREQWRP